MAKKKATRPVVADRDKPVKAPMTFGGALAAGLKITIKRADGQEYVLDPKDATIVNVKDA